jgi:polysaccharide biosynthesis transport protein
VAQPASYEPKPVRPQKPLVLGMGFLAALLGAAGISLLAEQRDRALRDAEDVEERLSLPVLGTLPRLPERQLSLSGNGRD